MQIHCEKPRFRLTPKCAGISNMMDQVEITGLDQDMINDSWNVNTPDFYSVLWPRQDKIKWQMWPLYDTSKFVYINSICTTYLHSLSPGIYLREEITKICRKTLSMNLNWKWYSDAHGLWYVDGILPKGPYPPCLRMADRALLAGYHLCNLDSLIR